MTPETLDILLVEDDQDDVDLALHALKHEHLIDRVLIARDGQEALDILFCRGRFANRSFQHPPRLVLLDLKLLTVSGMQVLEEVKKDPRTKSIPVVVMTSSSEERDLRDAYNLGANSYVQKPVDFDRFREAVKSLGRYWLRINQPDPAITERWTRLPFRRQKTNVSDARLTATPPRKETQ